jgi:hypothetical protein
MATDSPRHLVYPGAGFDTMFVFVMDYTLVTIYDGLPNNNHFPKGCVGWPFCENKKVLRATLCSTWGKHTEVDKDHDRWTVGKTTIDYHYNCDFDEVPVLTGKVDMLLRGYNPSQQTVDKWNPQTLFVATDTVLDVWSANEAEIKPTWDPDFVEYDDDSSF